MMHSVYCLGDNIGHARLLVGAMTTAGIEHDDIAILATHKKQIVKLMEEYNTQTAYGALIHTGKGLPVGWLRHLHMALLPGVGLLLTCNPLIKRVAPHALVLPNGSRQRWVIKEMGVPNEFAHHFEESLLIGCILISAFSPHMNCVNAALSALKKLDAQEIGMASVVSTC
jgi:hypothetical protein